MEYTKEQKEQIKKSFTASDRAKLKKHFTNGADRQYVNGLRRVSPQRAEEIAKVIGRKSIIKVLLPDVANIFRKAV